MTERSEPELRGLEDETRWKSANPGDQALVISDGERLLYLAGIGETIDNIVHDVGHEAFTDGMQLDPGVWVLKLAFGVIKLGGGEYDLGVTVVDQRRLTKDEWDLLSDDVTHNAQGIWDESRWMENPSITGGEKNPPEGW